MDIDERVAIEFKGWHLSPSKRFWLDAGGRYTGYCTPGHGDSRNEVWQPSKRIEQAMMAVEQIHKEHEFYLEWEPSRDAIVMFGDSMEMATTTRIDTLAELAELICITMLKIGNIHESPEFLGVTLDELAGK